MPIQSYRDLSLELNKEPKSEGYISEAGSVEMRGLYRIYKTKGLPIILKSGSISLARFSNGRHLKCLVLSTINKAEVPVGYWSLLRVGSYCSSDICYVDKKYQGQGIMRSLMKAWVNKYGCLASSDSVSEGSMKNWKELCSLGIAFVIWEEAKAYLPIHDWVSYDGYAAVPTVKAPDGKSYPIPELEDSIEKSPQAPREWFFGKVYVSKINTPPKGYKLIEV